MRLRRMAGWLSGLVRELNPAGGAVLPPLPGIGWLPHAAVVAVAVVLGVVAAGQIPGSVLVAVAFGVAQGLPLVLSLVRPMGAFWVSLLAGVLVSETVRAGGSGSVWAEPSLVAHLAVLAVVGLRCRARVLAMLWVATLLAGAILVQRMPGMNASPDLMEMSTLSAVVLVTAGALRGRWDALRRLADQERISEAERLRRSVLEERTRIARELHDVVAHHMSLIAIQAEAAPYRVADAPPELTCSFATIRVSAVEAMTELRRVLGVLRAPDEALPVGGPLGAGEAPPGKAPPGEAPSAGVLSAGVPLGSDGAPPGGALSAGASRGSGGVPPGGVRSVGGLRDSSEAVPAAAPQPRLGDLPALVGAVRAAGVVAELSVTGGVRQLDPGVELSGYRIVQEALSNSVRHAPGASVRVEVAYGGAMLSLCVVNGPSGRVSSSGGVGHGLVGMRERVTMLGGELSVGPLPDGGYGVTAVLPTGPVEVGR